MKIVPSRTARFRLLENKIGPSARFGDGQAGADHARLLASVEDIGEGIVRRQPTSSESDCSHALLRFSRKRNAQRPCKIEECA